MNDKKYKIAEYIDKELPADILEQLEVVGRVKHFLRPTSTSAISTAEDKPGTGTPGDGSSTGQTLREVQDDISKLIDDVAAFEADVEQLEELADEHLKNMSIPPLNKMIADAAKTLGSEDGSIDKDVLDRAITIMDFIPMLMSPGIDPVLAALTGDGTLSGPYLRCRDINSSVGKDIKLAARTVQTAELAIEDQGAKIEEAHNNKMLQMMIELLLNLWWNKLWGKFVVDLVVINPLRQMYANPYDKYISFFLNFERYGGVCKNKKRFRFKSKECVQGTIEKSYADSKGPINQLLNMLRMVLLCFLPKRFYRDYKPDEELKCPPETKCQDKDDEKDFSGFGIAGAIFGKLLGDIMDAFTETPQCVDADSLVGQANTKQPEGFGCPPDCVQAAKVVLNAVLSDAFKPPQAQVDTYNQYKQGL